MKHEEFARVAQTAVELFYREYASARKCTTPAFFAENGVRAGHIRWIMRQLYPLGREIFLVRDPRETLASTPALNARRPGAGPVGEYRRLNGKSWAGNHRWCECASNIASRPVIGRPLEAGHRTCPS